MKNFAKKMAAVAATSVVSLSSIAFADSEAVQVGLAYRQDSIKWNISDCNAANPHSKSSLHFRDLEIIQLGTKLKGMLGCSAYGRVSFDYGWVLDGRLKEKVDIRDVDSAHRFGHGVILDGEYVTAALKSHERGNSYVWDLNFAFGAPIDCGCSDFQFAPMVGFAYNRQHLKFRDGHLRIDDSFSGDDTSIDFSFSSRRHGGNSFQASFWGPWVGFDVFYNSQGCWNLFGEFELHFGRAERKRHARLGDEFLSHYQRTKNFWGPTFRLGGNYNFCECWYMEGALTYQYWLSYGCSDHLYWSSATVRFDVGHIF